MGTKAESELKRAVGAADMLELLARAFSYPDTALARALCDGSFVSDARSCAEDMDIVETTAEAIGKLSCVQGADAVELQETMRRGFSILYLAPGDHVPVYPYEGPFRFVADQRPGSPLLFRNRSAEDIMRLMKEEGLEPDPNRHEPADSIWFELAFFSHLYALLAQALDRDDESAIEERRDALGRYVEEHGRPWMEAFMNQTCEKAPKCSFAGVYGDLASPGAAVLPAAFTVGR